MDQLPVRGMAEHRGTMSQLDGDYAGCGTRADPCQDPVAVGVVRGQERLDSGRDPHLLVGLVLYLEGSDRRGNRVHTFRSSENLLVSLVGRGGIVALPSQAIAAADHVLVPPGPLLVIEQGEMQNNDPIAALPE